ncbi:hypothetical protein K505DRAFT_218067, partial [Melanomma pulvis-pyrius CBS 109.77]
AVAIPTLVGSICSLIAASFIFICYFIFPFKAHFRHILILNLATADFINALNNTMSGIYYISRGRIPTGLACTANGFIGQLSVQGTDFSILLIAIVTVIALKSPRFLPNTSLRSQILLSLVVWIVPLITSTTGLAVHAYGPVSGNWCWIKSDRADLRYALTHGWRMGIIITTIGLYAYLFFYVRQRFSGDTGPFELPAISLRVEARQERYKCQANSQALGELTGEFPVDSPVNELEGDYPTKESDDLLAASWVTNFSLYQGRAHRSRNSSKSAEPHSKAELNIETGDISNGQPAHATDFDTMNKARNKKIQLALLLNAYPIAYILLWLPGFINRFVELSTGKSSFVLQVLQSSTQFVGVANAITYGFNERVRRRV